MKPICAVVIALYFLLNRPAFAAHPVKPANPQTNPPAQALPAPRAPTLANVPYPTHSNGYYVCITGGSFTEVSCMGAPSVVGHLQPAHNRYKNPFGTEVALMRTSEGGMARKVVSWDTPGPGAEAGRIRGERGAFYKKYEGLEKHLPPLERPPLSPGVQGGFHGGSHGPLTNEFIMAILEDRQPLVNIAWALNLTVAGIVAHQSALKDGELLKIPRFTW